MDHLNVPRFIDLSEFMEKETKIDCGYELKAICFHSGSSTDNGHYTSNFFRFFNIL